MKKIITIIAALSISASAALAQGGLLGALKDAATTALGNAAGDATTAVTDATGSEELGSILGGLLGDLLNTYTTISLTGTWTYNGVATAISSDNTLVTLASSAYKTKLENKLNSYLSKVGIKPGSAVFTFTEDGQFSISNGTKVITNGTYTLDTKTNAVVLKYGQVYNYLTMEGTVAVTAGGCQILCDANKFLEFTKKAIAVAGKFVDTSAVAALLADANGLQLGFKLTKQN